jgi:GNAT superfamily N-acetyltransferase
MIIRSVEKKDVQTLLDLIKQLAVYEKLADQVTATEALLIKNGFSDRPGFKALLAEMQEGHQTIAVGFAVYFFTFSTFVGKTSLYLEDIFVSPQYRRMGIGMALFKNLIEIAKENDCGRMEWSVLNWNQSAIQFYLSLGAKPMSDWTVYRLDHAALSAL